MVAALEPRVVGVGELHLLPVHTSGPRAAQALTGHLVLRVPA